MCRRVFNFQPEKTNDYKRFDYSRGCSQNDDNSSPNTSPGSRRYGGHALDDCFDEGERNRAFGARTV
jgi:hypothetical protein